MTAPLKDEVRMFVGSSGVRVTGWNTGMPYTKIIFKRWDGCKWREIENPEIDDKRLDKLR